MLASQRTSPPPAAQQPSSRKALRYKLARTARFRFPSVAIVDTGVIAICRAAATREVQHTTERRRLAATIARAAIGAAPTPWVGGPGLVLRHHRAHEEGRHGHHEKGEKNDLQLSAHGRLHRPLQDS